MHASFQLKAISFVHTGHVITVKIIENNAFIIYATKLYLCRRPVQMHHKQFNTGNPSVGGRPRVTLSTLNSLYQGGVWPLIEADRTP